MSIADKLVLQRQHHLKWRSLDRLELILMMICGVLCFGFSLSVTADIVTRTIRRAPGFGLQEVTSDAVHLRDLHRRGRCHPPQRSSLSDRDLRGDARHAAADRRDHHPHRRAHGGGCLIYYGYINYLRGFGSFRLPSNTPIASLYAAIPLIRRADRAVHDRATGQRHPQRLRSSRAAGGRCIDFARRHQLPDEGAAVSAPVISGIDDVLLPVLRLSRRARAVLADGSAFSLGALLADVSLAAIMQKIFDGVDSEALLAIPFFLLVGELMSSANVVVRIANLSLSLVGHIRGGLSQVVRRVLSMFFSEMSGSTTADVAVMTRALGGPMKKEGYSPAFIAAIIAAASTIAALVPPSITAVVYGAVGNVSIAGPVHGRRCAWLDDRLRPDDLLLFLRAHRHAEAARAVAPGRVRGG